MAYQKPDVYDDWSESKQALWDWLESNFSHNPEEPIEINRSNLSDELGYSRTAIYNALEVFSELKLIEKTEERTGRGRGSLYSLQWEFVEKCHLKKKSNQKKKQQENTTKGASAREEKPTTMKTGNSVFRKYGEKFRTLVTNHELTANKESLIVGTIMKSLKGKHRELVQKWYRKLKYWLNGAKRSVGDFFDYFHNFLQDLANGFVSSEERQRRHEERQQEREEIRSGWEEAVESGKPKFSDYQSFARYNEALAEWEESH